MKRADNLAQAPAYRFLQGEIDRAECILDQLLVEGACVSLRQLAVNGRDLLALDGSKVIMKPSGKLGPIQDELRDLQLLDKTAMIERCGLPGETVYEKAADAKDTGYFAVLLVK